MPDPERRFHYPSKISWNELMSGGVVGCEHFNNGRKDYFLFGDQGKWGRYVANCWLKPGHTLPTPLIFDGVLLEYLPQFQQSYTRIPLSAQERDDRLLIESWLPSEYLSDPGIITSADLDGVPVLPITTGIDCAAGPAPQVSYLTASALGVAIDFGFATLDFGLLRAWRCFYDSRGIGRRPLSNNSLPAVIRTRSFHRQAASSVRLRNYGYGNTQDMLAVSVTELSESNKAGGELMDTIWRSINGFSGDVDTDIRSVADSSYAQTPARTDKTYIQTWSLTQGLKFLRSLPFFRTQSLSLAVSGLQVTLNEFIYDGSPLV
ncbi:MAG: hypothetical protein IPK58_22620 [Acidobacteria bacterium]|nr:hypothetical protein [Acidobacteriota bacterium]